MFTKFIGAKGLSTTAPYLRAKALISVSSSLDATVVV